MHEVVDIATTVTSNLSWSQLGKRRSFQANGQKRRRREADPRQEELLATLESRAECHALHFSAFLSVCKCSSSQLHPAHCLQQQGDAAARMQVVLGIGRSCSTESSCGGSFKVANCPVDEVSRNSATYAPVGHRISVEEALRRTIEIALPPAATLRISGCHLATDHRNFCETNELDFHTPKCSNSISSG